MFWFLPSNTSLTVILKYYTCRQFVVVLFEQLLNTLKKVVFQSYSALQSFYLAFPYRKGTTFVAFSQLSGYEYPLHIQLSINLVKNPRLQYSLHAAQCIKHSGHVRVYETLYGRSNPLRSAVNNDSQQSFAKLADVLIETLD